MWPIYLFAIYYYLPSFLRTNFNCAAQYILYYIIYTHTERPLFPLCNHLDFFAAVHYSLHFLLATVASLE